MDAKQFPGAPLNPPLSDLEVSIEANRCLYCYDAPCMHACPTHIDIPGFIEQIADGNLTGSARTIFDSNAMGASCAAVCPVEVLCEGACVYNGEDTPIRIGDLQRYATDALRESGEKLYTAGEPTGKKVAIIGGGPAGLSVARDLLRFGHAVTIFEAKDELGGLNTYGIVPFRLPKEVAIWEAQQVVDLGATVNTGVQVGLDVTIEELVKNYNAVVLACGMGRVPTLGVEGEEYIIDALELIENAKLGRPVPELGDRVIVIGAGNTAVDALTCSKRLGSERVTCFYRRGEEAMTAYEFEYTFAKQESIEFRWFSAPKRVITENGKVSAMEFVRTTLRTGDPRGNLDVIPGSEYTVPATAVIKAIGQSRLLDTFDKLGIAHDDGVVRVNDAFETSREGVFAAGDCIFEKGFREASVVEAAQQGKLAARTIDAFLYPDRPREAEREIPDLIPAGHEGHRHG